MLQFPLKSGRLALGLALTLAAGVGRTEGQQPVTLVSGPAQIALAGHVAELYDESGTLTLEDVRKPEVAARFAVSDRAVFARGVSADTYWYRWKLHYPAAASAASTWIVDLGIPTLDYLDVHVERGSGEVETILTGDLRPRNPRLIPYGTFSIPLAVVPGENLTLYVRLQTTGRHGFWPELWPEAAFGRHMVREVRAAGIISGVFLVTILYNLLLFVAIRDRAYLYYVLFLLTFLGGGVTYAGLSRLIGGDLFAGALALINATGALWPGLISTSLLLFSAEFMQSRIHLPRIHRILKWLTAFAALSVLIYPVAGFLTTVRLGLLVLAVALVVSLGISIYLAMKGVRAARYYLLAWGAVFAVQALLVAESVGLLVAGAVTVWGPGATACVAIALLSLALADRINTARREQFVATARADRLKSFLPGRVAELVQGGEQSLLDPKRRNVTVCAIDLRGFTPFSETSAPEDVMAVLREFYTAMGAIVEEHGGTVEHFAGDSMVIFFNAPLEIPRPEEQALQAALEMQRAFAQLRAKWSEQGHELGLGIGIADGFATIGAIGFAGRSQYAAIGAVTNLAARLCSSAAHGEILTTSRVLAAAGSAFASESAGEQSIKGFHRPVQVARIRGLRSAPAGADLLPAAQAK